MSNKEEEGEKNNTLRNISLSLDAILDKPADQWTQKEINIYHLLQNTLDKYKIRYSLAQFKLDVRDIRKNVKKCQWYRDSSWKKVINWCLDQLVVKSYQHSKSTGNFKLIVRFNQAKIRLEITKRDGFHYLLVSETENIQTNDLSDLENITLIFGINPTTSPEHRNEVVAEIGALIREIAMFYN